jgi:hypothetical protein
VEGKEKMHRAVPRGRCQASFIARSQLERLHLRLDEATTGWPLEGEEDAPGVARVVAGRDGVASEIGIVERNPDVILAPTTHGEKVRFETLANRAGWENVAAIKNRQVFLIDGDQVSRCGPRLLDALESMIQQVYPEALAQRE